MKTSQNVVPGFHAGLAGQLLAMLRAMLAMRACHLGFRTVAKAAWAATWLRPLVCWLVRSLRVGRALPCDCPMPCGACTNARYVP